MPIPDSFACAVAGAAARKAVISNPQALINFDGVALDGTDLDGLNMDRSRRL